MDSNPLTLLYSPRGTIGRAGYWIGFLLNFSILIAGASWCFYTAQRVPAIRHPGQPGQYPGGNLDSILAGEILVVAILLLLTAYSLVAVEVKRWHDRGMSGFMFFMRFFPLPFALILPPQYESILYTTVHFWILVQLGFARSAEPDEPGRYFGWSFFWGAFVAVAVLGLIVVGSSALLTSFAPDWTHRFQKEFTTQMAAARAGHPPTLFAFQSLNRGFNSKSPWAAAADQPGPPAYHGTNSKDFDRNRVAFAGNEITGISNVMVASGDMVTVIYNGGGRTVPATSLPQGFLDLWNITPERLEAADSR